MLRVICGLCKGKDFSQLFDAPRYYRLTQIPDSSRHRNCLAAGNTLRQSAVTTRHKEPTPVFSGFTPPNQFDPDFPLWLSGALQIIAEYKTCMNDRGTTQRHQILPMPQTSRNQEFSAWIKKAHEVEQRAMQNLKSKET
jgi:hypothetical protein